MPLFPLFFVRPSCAAARVELLMESLNIGPSNRPVVEPARAAAHEGRTKNKGNNGIFCGAAIELRDGTVVAGKNSPLMHASSSLVLNAIKGLAGIPDAIHLIAPNVIASVGSMKTDLLGAKSVSLDLEEMLIALSICAATNPTAQYAMEKLKDLGGCEVHMTHMPTPGDEAGLRRLGVNLTSEPNFATKSLFEA